MVSYRKVTQAELEARTDAVHWDRIETARENSTKAAERGRVGYARMQEEMFFTFLNEGEREEIERIFGPLEDIRHDENGEKVNFKLLREGNELGDDELVYHGKWISRPTEATALRHSLQAGEIRHIQITKDIEARRSFLIALNAEHREFLNQVKQWLNQIHTMTELYAFINMCQAHDERLSRISGRADDGNTFCDTFAALSRDFFAAEARIRKPKVQERAIPVHTVFVPQLMIKEKGGKAIAFTMRDQQRLEAEGFALATQG